ncbi:hypothetical protein [Rufibacter sp. LB8]|uniref:hypothetical protein n=1 Tax=Rufibacter sp. LB8 TaxID=2777781 RepID=UPI001CEF5F16|nr:hypothetical protein [Rufibacter sp. LB8]
MKTRYLFPHRFKKLGWALFLPALVLGLLLINELVSFPWLELPMFALYEPAMLGEPSGVKETFEIVENNLADEIIATLLLVGTLLVTCSEVKQEDEYSGKLRLESLLWATYVNAGLLIFCFFFVYGLGFYQIMVFNLFTLMILFLIRFHVVYYRATNLAVHEE